MEHSDRTTNTNGDTETRKIAIACQGGAAHSAFTAGVLEGIFDSKALDGSDLELVGISGTSGGAICSLLTWYGYLVHPEPKGRGEAIVQLLAGFWRENEAREWYDAIGNAWMVWWRRMEEAGVAVPAPSFPVVQDLTLRRVRELIEHQVDYARIRGLLATSPDHPTLYVSAVDVLQGEFLVFEDSCPDPNWRRTRAGGEPPKTVNLDPVLASAAMVPTMPTVTVRDHGHVEATCWDGMYAYNPAVRCLLERDIEHRPDEIWVIQIDPQVRDAEPRTPADILDRKFELSSNLSLNGELHWIRQINAWIDAQILHREDPDPKKRFKPVRVARIQMSKAVRDSLDLASKADRAPSQLEGLIADGKARAATFLSDRRRGAGDWWEPDFPSSYQPAGSGARRTS